MFEGIPLAARRSSAIIPIMMRGCVEAQMAGGGGDELFAMCEWLTNRERAEESIALVMSLEGDVYENIKDVKKWELPLGISVEELFHLVRREDERRAAGEKADHRFSHAPYTANSMMELAAAAKHMGLE